MSEASGNVYFVYGQQCEDIAQELVESQYARHFKSVSIEAFITHELATTADRVIICGRIDEIKQILKKACECGFSVALLAQKNQNTLRSTFEIPKNREESLKIALEGEPKPLDLLYANGEIVLWGAVIGDAPPLTDSSDVYQETAFLARYKRLLEALKKLKSLKQNKIKLTTAKGQEINTSATGIVIIEHDNHTGASSLVQSFLSVNDGKLSALLLSPASTADYLYYLYVSILKKTKSTRLPSSVGFIKSESLNIESAQPLEVTVDGEKVAQTPVEFGVKKQAVQFIASEAFWAEIKNDTSDKETLKLSGLPVTTEEVGYAQKGLPFFTHASEERYKDLFADLRKQGKTESTYLILMFLSTVLATVGLFLNSASVVIGAMLLAPLMQPIVSTSMGVLRSDQSLLFSSIRTVLIGVLIALFSAAAIAFLLPLDNLTDEISARLSPTLLDLIVALISGIAAAYAQNNDKIVGSLAGVSIAVALVPPLATAGIGLGWMNMDIFYPAFLLFITNLVGIIFAASLTFLVMGFSPVKRAKKGLAYGLLVSLIVAIPLYLSFTTMAFDSRILSVLEHTEYSVAGKRVQIENVEIKHAGVLVVKCDFIVDETLTREELDQFKQILQSELEMPLVLEVIQRIRF
ncbi:MAG: TIGR00341 family protein [Gammaproteobacteria bacterium]|nr:TIGR00341 family protein [Gammaproteobacteria bacterium]MCF6230686.1 TIGR00341 family protein [Gammaproteobacteria bacterium]